MDIRKTNKYQTEAATKILKVLDEYSLHFQTHYPANEICEVIVSVIGHALPPYVVEGHEKRIGDIIGKGVTETLKVTIPKYKEYLKKIECENMPN